MVTNNSIRGGGFLLATWKDVLSCVHPVVIPNAEQLFVQFSYNGFNSVYFPPNTLTIFYESFTAEIKRNFQFNQVLNYTVLSWT